MSGGLGGSQDTKTTQSGWKPAMNSIEQNLLPAVDQYATDYGQGQGLWSGSRLAPEDQLVRQGQEQQMAMGQRFGDQIGGAISNLEGFMNYDPNDPINQARREALGSQSRATFDQFLRPAVEDRATGSGQFGGPQASLATGAAMQGLNRDIVSAEAAMMDADRNRALQATGMLPGMAQQQFVPGAMMEQFGQQRTQRGQMETMDQIQQAEAERNNRMRSLQELSSLYNPMASLSQTQTTSGGGGSLLQTGLGLGAMYLGAGGGSQLGSLFGGGGGGGGGYGGGGLFGEGATSNIYSGNF